MPKITNKDINHIMKFTRKNSTEKKLEAIEQQLKNGKSLNSDNRKMSKVIKLSQPLKFCISNSKFTIAYRNLL